MKFAFAVRKLGATDLGRARGHNCRTHPTASQITDRSAWFGKTAHVALSAWNQDRAELARSLAKRKDAVVGIEFVVQVGNQLDWREEPTPECPAGKPRKPAPASLKKLAEAVQRWTDKEFGADNVVSIEAHLDESTPHIQCVVTPIHGDKLQAKHWLNGPAATAALRRRVHQVVNRVIPCTYEPGSDNGGKPHDPGKRAGVAPVPEAPGLLDKLTNAPDRRRLAELEAENAELRARVEKAEQVARSRAKAVANAQKEAKEAQEEAKAARRSKERVDQAMALVDATAARIKALEPRAAIADLFTPAEINAARQRAEKAKEGELVRRKIVDALDSARRRAESDPPKPKPAPAPKPRRREDPDPSPSP